MTRKDAAWPSKATALDLLADLLQQGGLGRCTPVWAGPTPDGVDPNGTRLFTDLLGLLGDA